MRHRSAFQQQLLAYWVSKDIAQEQRWTWDFTRSFLSEVPYIVCSILFRVYYDQPIGDDDVRILAKHGFATTGRKIGDVYSV